MPGITGGNANDFLKGALARVQIGKWVTGGGAATLFDCGFSRDIGLELSRDTKLIEVDNCTWALDGYAVKSTAAVKLTMVEAALRKLGMAMGDDPTATTGDILVAAGSAGYAIDEPSTVQWWQLVLTITGQSMKPAYTEVPTDVYIKRIYTFWKGLMKAKISQAFKRDAETVIPCELDCVLDTTVTYVKGTTGRIGKIIDSTT